jgi:hypothetical protein
MSILPEGTYKARAIDYAVGEAGTGTQQVGVACQVTQGPAAGQTRTWYGFFTDDGIEMTIKALRAMGWSTNSLDDLDEILSGKEFDIVIEHEPDRDEPNKIRDRIRWVNAGGVAMKKKLNGAEIAMLNKKIAGVAARIGGGGGGGGKGNAREGDGWRLNNRGRAEPAPRGNDAPWGRDDGPPPPRDEDAPPARRDNRGPSRW